jgi:hypothetical protein
MSKVTLSELVARIVAAGSEPSYVNSVMVVFESHTERITLVGDVFNGDITIQRTDMAGDIEWLVISGHMSQELAWTIYAAWTAEVTQ